MVNQIESKDNQLVKHVVQLIKDKPYRNSHLASVVYGEHLIEEAFKSNLLLQIFVLKDSLEKYQPLLGNLDKSIGLYSVSKVVIAKLNVLDTPSDIVGVISITGQVCYEKFYTDDCILLERIQDPGNLGTILRVAKATGIDNIGLIGDCVDVYSPKVLRASQGLQFGLNIYSNLDFVDFTHKYLGRIIATVPNASQLIYDVNLKDKVAFIFGNEGSGLSSGILDYLDLKVKIPMANQVESLNIAMAATVCGFELFRQRLC